MTSVSNLSISSTSSRTRRSLSNKFSSLGSFFGSKTNHINEYDIELDEPHRLYGPGETVSGTVVLNVAKPLGVTHIVVCLYGYVQVLKSNIKPKSGVRNTYGRLAGSKGKRWVSEYHGDGFASLFEEEIVLCGEGRLDPKLYHFRFDLEFPRDLALPTSIDFDRGIIAYRVASTLTRPTSITTTTNCERNVRFQEVIDVRTLPLPKSRVVTLEPVDASRKGRAGIKKLASPVSADKQARSVSSMSSIADASNRTIHSSASVVGSSPSTRPAAQDSSNNSQRSNSVQESAESCEARSSYTSTSPKVKDGSNIITATVELGRAGCVPGESVPLKVTIQHCKVVRSLHGIIVTLYRQARTDMHPNLPLGPAGRAEDAKYEDYYPRSRTGLGGMSLSAAGSSQVWRKDLSQTFAPLYIDPLTKSAEVKVGVRVPDDVFPSIRSAPGEMISFKYFVEVIIDIHGRLANQDRGFPSLNMTMVQPTIGETPISDFNDERQMNAVTAWGSNCIDTTQIRREKNAITCLCDLTVGTLGSIKSHGKQRQSADAADDTLSSPTHSRTAAYRPQAVDLAESGRQEERDRNGDMSPKPIPSDAYNSYHEPYANETYDGYNGYNGYDHEGYGNDYPYDASDVHYPYPYGYDEYHHGYAGPMPYLQAFPPAESLGEEDLPEKERLRRAEARLLPSQPPLSQEYFSSSEHAPSAPMLPNDGYLTVPQYGYQYNGTYTPSLLSPPASNGAESYRRNSSNGSASMRPSFETDGAPHTPETRLAPVVNGPETTAGEQEYEEAHVTVWPAHAITSQDDGAESVVSPVESCEEGSARTATPQGYGNPRAARRYSRGMLTESPSAGEEGLPRYER